MSKKKILYIQHSGAIGGAPMSLFYLLQHVKEYHHIVVYFIADGPAVNFFRKAGIECKVNKKLTKYPHCTIENQCLNPFSFAFYDDFRKYLPRIIKFLPSFWETKQIIIKEAPDIVHLNSSVLISEGLAAASLQIPLIWHCRDFIASGKFGIRQSMVSNIMSRTADKIIALCEAEAACLNLPTDFRSKIHIIPNFVDLDNFSPQKTIPVNLRAQLEWPANSKIVAMLGWNFPENGPVQLLEAFRIVLNKIPQARLALFGKGKIQPFNDFSLKMILKKFLNRKNFYEVLQEIIIANDMQDKIAFPGVFLDIANYIHEVDVVVVPFVEPHFARPILEAGAMCKVVVTTNLPGTREMVLMGEAGYLCEPENPNDLSVKLTQALTADNSGKIVKLRRFVEENYSANINAAKTLALYKSIL